MTVSKDDTIAALRQSLADMRDERDRWRATNRQDDEAKAIEGCVRALDAMIGRPPDGRASHITFNVYAASPRRVLRYLADRYGVTWYEPPTQEDTP